MSKTLTIAQDAVLVRYQTRLASVDGLLAIAVALIAILAPFWLSLVSDGFLVSHLTVMDRPQIRFSGNWSMHLSGSYLNPTGVTALGKSRALGWSADFSSDPAVLNTLLLSGLDVRFPNIQALHVDANRDAVNEKIALYISVPMASDEMLSSVRIELDFAVTLTKSRIYDQSTTLILAQTIPSMALVSSLTYTSSLMVRQQQGLLSPHTDAISLSSTLAFEMPLSSSSPIVTFPRARSNPLLISATLTTGAAQPYEQRPTWAHILKWAWVQYAAIGAVVYSAWRLLMRLAIALGAVRVSVQVDDPRGPGPSTVGTISSGGGDKLQSGGGRRGMVGSKFKPAYF
ncbi:hypothetical protein BC828DRAFT_377567 [Blastocladiella britannica]|nr:hypothetical protein BC828DRAFT_377567 [Blastocladiella britannica]